MADIKPKETRRFDLGIAEWPWPVLETIYDPGKGYSTALRPVENADNPLQIFSKWYGYYFERMGNEEAAEEAAYERIVGEAYRYMPVPGMLKYFNDSTNSRLPGWKDRLELVIGAAGMGKSFGAKLHSRLRGPDSALFFDCAGRDLGDLLFELVLDRGSNPDLYSRIQKRIIEHNSGERHLNPISLEILKRQELQKVFSFDGNRIAWHWDSCGELPKELATKPDAPKREDVLKLAKAALDEFSWLEGIQQKGISDITFKETKGKLLQAIEEDRCLILDEANLARRDVGFDKLKAVLQVVNGEDVEYTAYSKSGESYLVSNANFGPGFFVSANGNQVGDGNSTQSLPKSIYDRFKQKYNIGEPRQEDYQHRICQVLTGLPISTLYHLQQAFWQREGNPSAAREAERKAEFTGFLHYVRGLGLTEQERGNIPAEQKARIDNWEDMIIASEKLARYYHTREKYLNRESDIYRTGSLQDLAMEIDDHYAKMVGGGMRKVMGDLTRAETIVPITIPLEQTAGFNLSARKLPKPQKELPKEEIELKHGTRVTRILIDGIDNDTRQIPKPALNRELTKLAIACGILPPDLKEAKKSDQKLLAELLNIDSFKGQSPSQQAKMVRELLCDFLRGKYPDLSASNDDLITIPQVERQLRELGQIKEKDIVISTHATRMRIPNSDLDDVSVNPFRSVIVHSSTYDPARKTALSVPLDKLADHDAVVMALAIPAMREGNLTAMWNKSMINAGDRGPQYDPRDDDNNQVLRMAMRDNPKYGISITTVPCRKGEDKPHETTVHVIRDDKANKTIVIGESVDPRTTRMMARTGLTYIDKTKPGASASLSRAITKMLQQQQGNAVVISEDLQAAFLMSNTLLPRYEGEQMSLAEMMTRDVTRCDVKNYATDAKQLEELLHLQRTFQSTTTSKWR